MDFCPEGCYWDCEHRKRPSLAATLAPGTPARDILLSSMPSKAMRAILASESKAEGHVVTERGIEQRLP